MRKIEKVTKLSLTSFMFCVSSELWIFFNTSVKNLLELSACKDVQESFKLWKLKEAFCDNNNGAINKIL